MGILLLALIPSIDHKVRYQKVSYEMLAFQTHSLSTCRLWSINFLNITVASSASQATMRRLHADLQRNGVRYWFAQHDIKIGDKIRPRIDESIRLYDKLLLYSQNTQSPVNGSNKKWREHERKSGKSNALFSSQSV
jgi:hypothetical protein